MLTTILAATAVVWQRGAIPWRRANDREVYNAQLKAFAASLGSSTTRAGVPGALAAFPHLSLHRSSDQRWRVATPRRLLWVDNWVAWLEFRPDGRLLAARFGTLDSLGDGPLRPQGLPADVCFGTRGECILALAR
jgi:hypothetical protein